MLFSLALIFLLGLSAAFLCRKIGLPRILGMLLVGIALGPYALNLLSDEILSVSAPLRQMALIIILIKAGLSLDIADLKKVGRPAFLMSFVPACFEILAFVLFAPRLLGLTLAESALLGSVIAAVSPAVVVPKMVQLMEEKCGTAKGIPRLILAGASMDDIFVIVLFSAFTAMVQGEGVSASSFVSIPVSIVTGVILGALVGLALYTFFETAFSRGKYIRNSVKLIIMLAFLLVSAEEFLKGIIPLSGLLAVTAMAAVIKLKSSKGVSARLSAKFGKLWIASELILFTLVGAAVDISYTLKAGPLVLVMLCISLIFRACGVFICLLGTKLSKKGKAFLRDSLYPKGYGAGGNRLCALGFGTCVRQHSAFGGRCRHTLYGAFGMDMTAHKLLEKN